jgi:hypothetical protein
VAALALLAVPLAGSASAVQTPAARCRATVAKTQYFPTISQFTFTGGTDGPDRGPIPPGLPGGTPLNVAARTVYCGFGGNDFITDNEGWTFAGSGDDLFAVNNGTFIGGPGNDITYYHGVNQGVFIGNSGNDSVYGNSGRFNGNEDDDSVGYQGGIFSGGAGNDVVYFQSAPLSLTNGGAGDDVVDYLLGGTFNGGSGNNVINHRAATGTICINAVVLSGPACG